MGILLNKAAMSDKDFSVNIVLADIQQQYLLKFYGGVMLVFNPLMALAAIVIGTIIFFATRYANAFVLVFSLLCPILSFYNQLWRFEQGDDYFVYIIDYVLRVPFPFVLMLVVLIFYGNAIGKMVRGKEDKLYFKPKKQ